MMGNKRCIYLSIVKDELGKSNLPSLTSLVRLGKAV